MDENLTKNLSVMLTPGQHKELIALAKMNGRKKSDQVRFWILRELKKERKKLNKGG